MRNNILKSIFASVLLAIAMTVKAFVVDGIHYNIISDEENTVAVEVIRNDYTGDISIPDYVTYNNKTYSVTSISSWAFSKSDGLTSITIPESVTSIDDFAFYGCSVKSITIPNSVTSIGESAFERCHKLTSVIIGNSVTSIGEDAFYYCGKLTSVIIGNSVTTIGNYAFSNCTSLTSVTIPESVTSIGDHAFKDCNGLTKVIVKDIGAWCKIKFGGIVSNPLEYAKHLYSDETTEVTELVIPDTVTSIGGSAFLGCSDLTSVTIPSSVTSIGGSAFSGCSGLTSVTIPNSVTSIGGSAFSGCSGLTSVTIGNSVTSIGNSAFLGCSGLTTVTIPNSVTSIGGHAFYNCTDLTSVTIPSSVTSIGKYAFCYCTSLTSIAIPESVTSIGNGAFSGCSGLSSIAVNEDNTKYDSRDNCNAIIDTKTNTLVIGCKNTIIPEGVTCIGDSAFYWCTSLTSVTIPESVTSISSYAFCWCTSLPSVAIPSSVTSIGHAAFTGCSGLTSVTVKQETPPNFQPFANTTNVTLYVPYSCKAKYEAADYWKDFKKIEEMEIPPVTSIALNKTTLTITEGDNDTLSVTYTPTYADGRSVTWTTSNANIATVDAQGKVTAIAEGVVIVTATTTNGKIAQCVVNVKKDTVNISFADPNVKTVCVEYWDTDGNGKLSYDEAAAVSSIGEVFRDKKNITSFEELRYFTGLTEISNNAFSGCAKLTSIVIPDNVASIGRSAFSGCSDLTSVTIPKSVANIGESAFFGCSGLASITIPNNVTSIDKSTFLGCSGLTSVIIPESVASIDESAFSGCSGLESIIIPNNVTSIGDSTFFDCSGLTSVTIPENVTNIGSSAFSGCSGLESIIIPNNVTSIGDSTFFDCSGLTSVTIPENVTNIGSSAFSGCSGLAEIIIPDSVKSIGKNAFSGCTGIRSVTIPSNVSSIGNSAFAGCSNIKSVKWNAKYYNSSSNPFSDAPNILEFVVGKDVINIPDYLFYGMNNLRSLTIGAGVLTIGNQGGITPAKVFWMPNTPPTGCNNVSGMVNYTSNDSFSQPNNSSSLQNIRICRYLSSIFEVDGVRYVLVSPSERTCNAIDCVYDSTLCEVNIDKTVGYKGINLQVKDINPYTFYSNTYIKKAYIDTDGELGAHAFENCNNMTVCTMGDRITKIDDYAFSGCKVLHRAGVDLYQEDADYNGIIVSKAVSHIGDYAFYGCSNIKNVIMEDRKDNDMQLTLGSNGSSPLFSSCPLDSVYIGRNITYSTTSSAGYSPFYRNTSLRTVHITDKETEISDNEFYGCTNLKRITIGDGVKTIGSYAFSGCSSLEGFICGTRLEAVGEEAFSDCTAMTTFKSKAVTPPTCGSQALDDINKWECTLHVPRSSIGAYQGAEQWKEFFFVEAMPLEKGDVNGDDAITMADANAVVNYFLATDKPQDFDVESADVNGDGSITMADANQIVNMFLGGK